MDKAEINENISKIIKKLETLKTAKERYSKASLQYPWYRDDLHNSLWSKAVQPLVDEIEIDLVELWDCILENTKWNKAGIENAIRSRRHDNINMIDRLIRELRLIQKRLEIKSKQYQESAETEQNNKPAGTGQKEIVEVKPSVFGITVDIKELVRRFWKWVCSRRKD